MNLLRDHPAVAPNGINKSEFVIRFNNPDPYRYYMPDLTVMGINNNNGDRARGLKIWHIGGDEWQDWIPSIFDEIVAPAMGDLLGSTALFTCTPKGKANHTYHRYQQASENPSWQAFRFRTSDNPFFPRDELARLEKSLHPRIFAQEMLADFVVFEGQFFETLTEQTHLVDPSSIPKCDRYVMGVDWGAVNPRATVCGYKHDGTAYRWWIVDEWRVPEAEQGTAILEDRFRDECDRLAQRWQVSAIFCDPSRPDAIKALKKHAPSLVSAKGAINQFFQGINILSSNFYHKRILVSTQLPKLFEELQNYHRAKDRYGNILEEEAKDGQSTHGIDCIRYAVGTIEGKVRLFAPY